MIYTGRVDLTTDGDRLNSISSLSLRFADGDRWCGARGLGPCRLIIDQWDRDGSRGREDIAEWRERCGGEAAKWEDFKEFVFYE